MTEQRKTIPCEELHKELDLIQGCISRMANHSFLLKGWMPTLVAAIVAMTVGREQKPVLFGILCLIVASFWYLDAYYLRTERSYRKLYNWVLDNRRRGSRELQYDLDVSRFAPEVKGVIGIMFSKTLRWYYGIAMVILVGLTVYSVYITGGMI